MFSKTAAVASLAALALTATATATAAYAGNGAGPNKSSSISSPIVMTAGTATLSATSGPRFGDRITFNVATTQTDNPFVNLNCYQNGGLVENSWDAFWPSNGSFTLSSPAWTSGAADCTASLGMYVNSVKYKILASTTFHVDA